MHPLIETTARITLKNDYDRLRRLALTTNNPFWEGELEKNEDRLQDLIKEEATNLQNDKAQQMLDEVNGRAKSFTLDISDLSKIAQRAENQLDESGLPKSKRVGAIVFYAPAGPSAKRYKYNAISTTVTLRRVKNGWRLIDASRCSARPQEPEHFRVRISPEQSEIITAHAMRNYIVDPTN